MTPIGQQVICDQLIKIDDRHQKPVLMEIEYRASDKTFIFILSIPVY